ncbi:hypothetical protein [Endozoicomonas acroporae]|uniref:hypothetical protein n=1 Tax=Endozoicomonas acroporae TaxID=1701104 RepID=UPI003D78C576
MIHSYCLPTSSTSDLPGIFQESNAVTHENVDTSKTVGLDKPETHGAPAKPLAAYSIESSDDEFEGDGNGILKLKTGDYEWVTMNRNVQAVKLGGGLFLVHVPDKGEHYAAWYMKPRDFTFLVDPSPYEMFMTLSFFPERIRDAEINANNWKEEVQKYPGTTYLCGPGADESAQELFNADPVNTAKTEKGPVSVTFNFATRSFHTNYHDRHSQS